MAVRLNYDLFRRYLGFLQERDLVRQDEDRVRLTAAGRAAREELVRWIADVLGQSEL